MVREIVVCGSKVLRRKCQPVAKVDSEVRSLVQDLFDSLGEADGVGLAAPQIGVTRRVIVVDISSQEPEQPLVGQFSVGDRVRHPTFGEGIVMESKISGGDEEVTVVFERLGIKRLLVSFANLELMN